MARRAQHSTAQRSGAGGGGLAHIGQQAPAELQLLRTRIEDFSLLVSRTGYTGELGYELYLPWDKAEWLWERLLNELVIPLQ